MRLRSIEATLVEIKADLEAAAKKAELERLRLLIVRPTAPSRSSPSRTSARAADEQQRIELKVRVLQYYGLLVSSEGTDKKLWTARTMLHSSSDTPLPLEACTLAHIWPSEQEMLASEIAAQLQLPAGFYLNPRNYLILPKDAHDGFDNQSLLLLPQSNGSIAVRKWRTEDRSPEEATAIAKYYGRELWWPNKDSTSPNIPFMRLLAFRMISAKQQRPADEPDAVLGTEQEAALNASVTSEGNAAVRELCGRLSLL